MSDSENPIDNSLVADSPKPIGDRLQKVLAQTGIGSRREIERWISQGRVAVNGEIATLGDRVIASDRIFVDGKKVHLQKQKEQLLRKHLSRN